MGSWLPDVKWATMDSEACPYLDEGQGCNNKEGTKYLVMDIPVNNYYPAREI